MCLGCESLETAYNGVNESIETLFELNMGLKVDAMAGVELDELESGKIYSWYVDNLE